MKFHLKAILIFLLIFTGFMPVGFASYNVNENCILAWNMLMDLKIAEAKSVLAQEITVNPDNYFAYYLDQTCDAYALLINGSEEDYEAFVDNYEAKREIMDGKSTGSPYYLMCKSEMELQVAVFDIIHGSRFSGLNKAYNAFKSVYNNLDSYPGFKPSLKLDGFFNVAMSNLPPFVKWAVSFFGVTSDFDYGWKLLNDLYESEKDVKGFNAEYALFVIFGAKINKTPELVYDFTRNLVPDVSKLFIHKYFKANIAYRVGKNEEALQLIEQLNPENSQEARLLYNYLKGKVLLRKLDDSAGYYIGQYLAHLKKKEYLKEMTYNLALNYLLKGDRSKYHELCETVVEEGKEINERDREALYDAELDYEPDIRLVKARLLLAGSYYQRFLAVIAGYEKNPEHGLPYELEYNLLNGKYAFENGKYVQAVKFLNLVIRNGEDEDYYFACDAALTLGQLYELQRNYPKAKEMYALADDLYDSDYYEYLGDKAKKGLDRVKKKLETE